MNILITGAAGFLGQHFYRALVREHDVMSVDLRSGPGLYGWRGDAAEYLAMEERKPKRPFDQIFHFAAPVGGREKIEGDPLYNADSLRLDSAVFRYASRHPGITVVYPSSSAVYGLALQSNEKSEALEEADFHPAEPVWFAPDEMYGFTKMAGEVLAWKAAKYGVNTLCIRPFSGYGEGQSFDYPVPSIAARALWREDPLTIWGSGHQARDFIHVDDVVGATLERLTYKVDGYEALNLGSGVATTFYEVAQTCADIVGYQPTIVTDESKPEGVKRRWAGVLQMNEYYRPQVSLREGLERVLTEIEQRRLLETMA